MNPRLDAALDYATRGWPVFPCHHPTPTGCSCHHADCPSPAKHPTTRRGHNDATLDPDRIRRWWHQHPNSNIGIRTGGPTGLVVLDLDLPDGPANLRRLAKGRLNDGLAIVRTGSGGTHLYFHHPGKPIRNSASKLGPGIDVRGDGGYILAPPSRHMSGEVYQWTRAPARLPELPAWITRALDPPEIQRPFTPPRKSGQRGRGWAEAVYESELAVVRSAPEGTRNDTLNRAAFRLGRLAGRGELPLPVLEAELIHASKVAGLSQREAERTTRSGLQAGIRSSLSRFASASPGDAPGRHRD